LRTSQEGTIVASHNQTGLEGQDKKYIEIAHAGCARYPDGTT
jgi:hypothetical protein